MRCLVLGEIEFCRWPDNSPASLRSRNGSPWDAADTQSCSARPHPPPRCVSAIRAIALVECQYSQGHCEELTAIKERCWHPFREPCIHSCCLNYPVYTGGTTVRLNMCQASTSSQPRGQGTSRLGHWSFRWTSIFRRSTNVPQPIGQRIRVRTQCNCMPYIAYHVCFECACVLGYSCLW